MVFQQASMPVNIVAATERLSMDVDFVKRMLGIFVEEAPRQIETIRQAVVQADGRTLERVAHSLKGAAATLSIEGMRIRALELETLGKEQRFAQAAPVLEALQWEMERVARFMEAWSQGEIRL